MTSVSPSKLYIVGAGPGDPELITLKALKVIQKAEVILYDALVNVELLELAPPPAICVFVGKRKGHKAYTQEEIHNAILDYAQQYTHIVRLKGGDPFVFGRGGEEWNLAIAQGMEVEYIPGISSSIAVAGLAGIPVTHRDICHSFRVITATDATGQLCEEVAEASTSATTVVILMGLSKLEEIGRQYISQGRGTMPVAVIQDGSLPTQRTLVATMETIAHQARMQEMASPSIIVVGEVVHSLRRSSSLLQAVDSLPQGSTEQGRKDIASLLKKPNS